MTGDLRFTLRPGQRRGVACELVIRDGPNELIVHPVGREKALQWIAQLAEGLEWIDKPRA